MNGQQAAAEVDFMMAELDKRRSIMAQKRANAIRIRDDEYTSDGITPGTVISTEGVMSASSHLGTVQLPEWLKEKAVQFAT